MAKFMLQARSKKFPLATLLFRRFIFQAYLQNLLGIRTFYEKLKNEIAHEKTKTSVKSIFEIDNIIAV